MAAETHVQEVPPAHGRGELRGVLLLAAAIGLAWAGGLAARREAPEAAAPESFQRYAFSALGAREQGLFTDLLAAVPEIRAEHDQRKAWPEPAALAELALPPFVNDAVWIQRGRHAWQRLDAHSPTHAVYWGKTSAEEWALVLSGETAAVWGRPAKPEGAIPQAIPELLVLDGWVQFLPRNPRSS
jgi:hypothetical protein